jgi:hypothetical protein
VLEVSQRSGGCLFGDCWILWSWCHFGQRLHSITWISWSSSLLLAGTLLGRPGGGRLLERR